MLYRILVRGWEVEESFTSSLLKATLVHTTSTQLFKQKIVPSRWQIFMICRSFNESGLCDGVIWYSNAQFQTNVYIYMRIIFSSSTEGEIWAWYRSRTMKDCLLPMENGTIRNLQNSSYCALRIYDGPVECAYVIVI